jgi:hypothetical protein
MYAHVNVWRLNDAGATWDDTAAREIAERIAKEPGFRAYTCVRTAEWEVVALTVFDSEAQLLAAVERLRPIVRERVRPLAAGPPARREGTVLAHRAA